MTGALIIFSALYSVISPRVQPQQPKQFSFLSPTPQLSTVPETQFLNNQRTKFNKILGTSIKSMGQSYTIISTSTYRSRNVFQIRHKTFGKSKSVKSSI
jgi:hypothetical protein